MQLVGLKNLLIPTILLTALFFSIAMMIDRYSLFYKRRVNAEISETRFHSIDGVRGFLALSVFYCHSVANHGLYSNGNWTNLPSYGSIFFGKAGVAMFFMVTAYLFWGRALANDGKIDTQKFLRSRFFRLMPMYLVVCIAAILTAICLTHFRLNEPLGLVAKEIVSWLTFVFLGYGDPFAPEKLSSINDVFLAGLYSWKLFMIFPVLLFFVNRKWAWMVSAVALILMIIYGFCNVDYVNINGFPKSWVINSVFWTLAYEWKFYLIFPFLAIFARGAWNWILLAVSSILVYKCSANHVEWYFFYGAIAASLHRAIPVISKILSGKFGMVVLILCAIGIFKGRPDIYGQFGSLALAGVFLVIASGNSIFGLLTSRPARVLGLMSYSIYLTHCFVIYLAFRFVNHFTEVSGLSVFTYWLIIGAVGVVTVCVSALTFKNVEFRFLASNKRESAPAATFGVAAGTADNSRSAA